MAYAGDLVNHGGAKDGWLSLKVSFLGRGKLFNDDYDGRLR